MLHKASSANAPPGQTVLGTTWIEGPKFSGNLSAPEIEGVRITIPIDTLTNESALTWSDEVQRERYPNDVGFAQIVSAANSGGINSTWP